MEEEDTKHQSKRPDRAVHFAERKARVETVVKSSLLKYVCGDASFKEAFVQACRKRVDAFSRRAVMASLRLSGLVKHIFHGHDDVCDVVLPDIFETTFVRQLMLGTKDATSPIPEVTAFLEKHPDGLEEFAGERHEGDRNIYCYGASKYITNLKNALKSSFKQRIVKYLKHIKQELQLSNEQTAALLFRITGWKMPANLANVDVSAEPLQAVITHQRRVLGLSNNGSVDDTWFGNKGNLFNVLRQWVFFNRVYEATGFPPFPLIPTCKMRHHFITIDTSSLFGILKEMKAISGDLACFDVLRIEQWNSILNLKHLQDRIGVREFSFILDTDSVSACTHWVRPKTPEDESNGKEGGQRGKRKWKDATTQPLPPPLDPSTTRVVAIDPGRVITYYAVEKMGNGRFKSYTMTRREYYAKSGVFEARKQTEEWSKGIKESLVKYSKVSVKGVDIEHHNQFLAVYKSVNLAIWSEYTKSRWARQRLRLYGGKKRAFSQFFQTVQRGDDRPELKRPIVIAYGGANIGTGGRGELSSPTSRAYKECLQRYECRAIDEFRTSKVNWETGDILQLVGVVRRCRKRMQRLGPLRGLLWYNSTIDNSQSKFVGRDFNAALNIWRCATNATRPAALCRVQGQSRIVQHVGKIIHNRPEPLRYRLDT